jgi:hypothetical protein
MVNNKFVNQFQNFIIMPLYMLKMPKYSSTVEARGRAQPPDGGLYLDVPPLARARAPATGAGAFYGEPVSAVNPSNETIISEQPQDESSENEVNPISAALSALTAAFTSENTKEKEHEKLQNHNIEVLREGVNYVNNEVKNLETELSDLEKDIEEITASQHKKDENQDHKIDDVESKNVDQDSRLNDIEQDFSKAVTAVDEILENIVSVNNVLEQKIKDGENIDAAQNEEITKIMEIDNSQEAEILNLHQRLTHVENVLGSLAGFLKLVSAFEKPEVKGNLLGEYIKAYPSKHVPVVKSTVEPVVYDHNIAKSVQH